MEFAVIGDFGTGDAHASQVASLVASWDPGFVIALGDNYYAAAGGRGSRKYDRSVGALYCRWLSGVSTDGSACPVGQAGDRNAFFPVLGNHDYSDAGIERYLSYFALPGAGLTDASGNERYYEVTEGPVTFFMLNSEREEPDGVSADSKQADWLRRRLAASTSPWKVVCLHRPPYSSDDRHGSSRVAQWPYAAWGADAVMSGHAHAYERVMRDGIVYFVNGVGGASRYGFGAPVKGSSFRFNRTWGAQRATATSETLEFTFVDVDGTVIDRFRLTRPR